MGYEILVIDEKERNMLDLLCVMEYAMRLWVYALEEVCVGRMRVRGYPICVGDI